MSCTVFVHGFEVDAMVGVYAHEERAPQPLIFDVEAELAAPAPAHIGETLDYDRIADAIGAVVAAGHIRLIEQAAVDVARRVLAAGPVVWVRVRVRKPHAMAGAAVAGCEVTLASPGLTDGGVSPTCVAP